MLIILNHFPQTFYWRSLSHSAVLYRQSHSFPGRRPMNGLNVWKQQSGIHLPPITWQRPFLHSSHTLTQWTQQCLIYTGMLTNPHRTEGKYASCCTMCITWHSVQHCLCLIRGLDGCNLQVTVHLMNAGFFKRQSNITHKLIYYINICKGELIETKCDKNVKFLPRHKQYIIWIKWQNKKGHLWMMC